MSTVFQHLLLATEHSEFDSGAEALAMALASRCQLPLAGVMPLLSNPEFEAAAPALAARADQQAAARIAELHEMARARGVSLAMQALRGQELHQEIVDEARERHSDLIIIRRRGKRGFLANLLLGEMVSRVVANAPCSVLIVPRAAKMWQQRVLVAAEPGVQGERLVALAGAVAAECRLPVSVVCVADGGREAESEHFMQAAVTLLMQRGISAQGHVLAGRPYEQILQAAQRLGADLIVMGSRGDAHLGRALIGGVAQKVIGLTEHPVLVAHTA